MKRMLVVFVAACTLWLTATACSPRLFRAAVVTAAIVGAAVVLATHDAHFHDHYCGHRRRHHHGHWTYYYNDHWEYYDERDGRWYYYD
jgi:hypothetical protein